MHTFMIFAQILVLVLVFSALLLILHTDVTNMQQMMVFFLVCSLVQNAGYLLELASKEPQAALWAIKMQYLGSGWVILFFLRFIYYYCGVRLPRPVIPTLVLVNMTIFGFAWTSDKHTMFYRAKEFVTEADGYSHFVFQYGFMYYIFAVFCCAIPCAMALWALFLAVRRHPDREETMHFRLITLLCLVPTTVLALYSFKVIKGYDPCPGTLAITLSFIVIFVWAKQNYDLSRVAANTALAEIDDCVIFLDNEQRITGYNPAATGIFITLNPGSVGQRIQDLDNFPMDIFGTEGPYEFQLHGGYFEGHLKVIYDRKGTLRGYVLLVFDITRTKNYIEEIKEMRERAEEANSVKGEFLANMSHEIRTPMNAIMGLSDLLKEESKGKKIFNYACDIKAASQNLLAILDNILNISKVKDGKMELVENAYYIKKLVHEVTVMMQMAAKQQGLEMRCEIVDTVPCKFYGDDGSIRQILVNVLNNAIKFTREGYVQLTVDGSYTTSGMWNLVFRVEDTGIGIKKEDMEKIFESFIQVDSKNNRNVGGTGLGLSISRKLAELMKGKIEVESVYGEGSTFTITLLQQVLDKRTVAEQEEEPEMEQEDEMRMFTAPDYKILVVDDNLINRQVAVGMLKPYGVQLAKAESGPEAIELVKNERFDLIFMDHMMPDMDGVETTKILRADCGENGSTPIVVALTANVMPGVKEMFMANGFQDFLAKPVDREPMYRMLDKWIPDERKVYADSEESQAEEESASEKDFSDIVMDSIDIKKVMEYHTGTVDDYLELLQLFYMDGLKKTKYLQELLECEDMKNYRIEVHALKSASANIGAMVLSGKAKIQEDAAAAQDVETVRATYAELMELYKKLLDEIKELLGKKGRFGAEDDTDKPEIAVDAMQGGIREALEFVERFKTKLCAEKVEWLMGHKLPSGIREQLAEIRTKLKMYEDDDAEDMLRSMVENF